MRDILGELPAAKPRAKVVLIGGPVCAEDSAVFEVLEAHQIGVVPLTCTGLNAIETRFDPIGGSWREVVRHIAKSAFHGPACIRQRPNTRVYERLSHALTTPGVRGVILKSLKFCDLWHAEKERMRAAVGLPFLALDAGFSAAERERVQSRLEAFVEVL